MPSRAELLQLAEDEAERSHQIDWATQGAGAVVAALAALRLTVAASLEPAEAAEEEPPRWMCVELFGHQVVYGLAGEVFWAGRRWLEVAWPTIYDKTGDGVKVEAGSKRYHPNAVYAMETIGEEAVRKALSSFGGLGF